VGGIRSGRGVRSGTVTRTKYQLGGCIQIGEEKEWRLMNARSYYEVSIPEGAGLST